MILDLVKSVADSIDTVDFFESASISDGLLAVSSPQDAGTLRIMAFPGEVNASQLSRASHKWEIPVMVAVQRRLEGVSESDMMEVSEQIASHFVGRAFTVDGVSAKAGLSTIPQITDRDLLHRSKVFESVIEIVFTVVRTA
jgi:hypothetical protein